MSRMKVEKAGVEENGVPGTGHSKMFWGRRENSVCEVVKEDRDEGREIETIRKVSERPDRARLWSHRQWETIVSSVRVYDIVCLEKISLANTLRMDECAGGGDVIKKWLYKLRQQMMIFVSGMEKSRQMQEIEGETDRS